MPGKFKFCQTAQESASYCSLLLKQTCEFLQLVCYVCYYVLLLSCLLLLLLDSSLFFCSLKIIIIKSFSVLSIVTRLRLQNGIGQKWLLLCQESHASFCFSRDPLPYMLTLPFALYFAKYFAFMSYLIFKQS